MQNGAGERQTHICGGRALDRLAAAAQRGAAAALLFVLCFLTFFSLPLQAADRGEVHHVDTRDYCLRSADVTVNMSELQGLDPEQKQALVEKASAYAIYKWEKVYEKWGEPVSACGDFGSVNWDQAGSYTVTVRMPALTEGLVSEVSYTLTILDDLPAEPEPPAPALYRVTVCFLDMETGEALGEEYVIDDIEEGTFFEIGSEILSPPEGYTAVEVVGDLEGEMTGDREIIVICRRQENDPQEPEDPEGGHTDPDEGQGGEGEDPSGSSGNGSGNSQTPDGNGSAAGSNGSSGQNSGKNTGKNTGKNSGKNPGKTSGKSSSVKKNGTASSAGSTGRGQAASASSGTPQTAQASPQIQAPAAGQESGQEETVPVPEEPLLTGQEAEIPGSEDPEDPAEEEAPAQGPEKAVSDTALAGGDQDGSQAALGGAVIAQGEAQKGRYPLWSMALATGEGGILAVLGYMIFSDLKLILWFENKKKR